jgi:uncharacterized HhH-GPD family protein
MVANNILLWLRIYGVEGRLLSSTTYGRGYAEGRLSSKSGRSLELNQVDKDDRLMLVEQLIKFGQEHEEAGKKENDEPDPAKDPLKFLLGVIFDQGIRYERAWKAPAELEKRLGHLDILRISKMRQETLKKELAKHPALARFNNNMAAWIKAACIRLLTKYHGHAEEIWSGNKTAKDIAERFDEFEGIGQKKSSMAVNILVREYDIPISGGKEAIDISYDVHVRRVFLRTGLATVDSERSIVGAARRLNPRYPGALDYGAWRIGHNWCHSKNPDCAMCLLNEVCPKKFRNRELVMSQ